MPTRADVERFADANRNIRALVLADLERLWRALDTQNADATRDFLLDAVPLLVASYGDVAATVAADFYDEVRDASRALGRFTAVPAGGFDLDDLLGQVRYSVGPLYSANPDPGAALGRLSQKVDEFTLQPGRDTIAESVTRDPAKPRWARVPVGETCAFCLMLASRGAVYGSEVSARKFHGNDDCVPTPVWRDDPYPEGYDPDALYEQYNAARKAAGSGRPKAILSELRSQTGGH
jgi:hypothetical protein